VGWKRSACADVGRVARIFCNGPLEVMGVPYYRDIHEFEHRKHLLGLILREWGNTGGAGKEKARCNGGLSGWDDYKQASTGGP
jgi:hypothetical protein